MDYVFKRPDFSDWTIIVKNRTPDKTNEQHEFNQSGDFEEFSGIFRTGMRAGKQCEMFTLLDKNIDYAYLWVNIFKNGDIEYVSHIPSVINADKKKKSIEILPLVYCSYNSKKKTFKYTYLDEYKTDMNAIIE